MGPGQTVFSVAEELQVQPFDIVNFNIDINPAYTLLEGSVLTVPMPRSKTKLAINISNDQLLALMLIPSLALCADTKLE